MTPYLELAMWSRGVRVAAGVNDAPILFGDPEGQSKQGRMPINWWLVPGPNRLTVRVEPLPGADSPPMLDLSVAFPEDASPPLCRVGWGLPRGADFAPFTLGLPFHPPRVPACRVWRDARALAELTPAHRAGAQALAMAVHGAFAARDVDAIVRLLDYRLEEMSVAFEMDLARHRRVVREDMHDLVHGERYALEPAEQGAIQVNPCCGGRVFQLARADGGPLVATLPTDAARPTTMQVFGALVGEEWRVVR